MCDADSCRAEMGKSINSDIDFIQLYRVLFMHVARQCLQLIDVI